MRAADQGRSLDSNDPTTLAMQKSASGHVGAFAPIRSGIEGTTQPTAKAYKWNFSLSSATEPVQSFIFASAPNKNNYAYGNVGTMQINRSHLKQ